MHRVLRCIVIGAALVALAPSLASGQMSGNIEKLKNDLHGPDLDRAVAAASALGSLKNAEAREALMGALQLGAPPKLTLAIIEALGQLAHPDTINLLRHFARYRRQAIRVAAVAALAKLTDDKRVVPILIDALGDSSPMVRAKAARVLGERKERRAERPLFLLLTKGDKSAAKPLGVVGGTNTAIRLSELIDDLPPSVLATTFGTMLKRKDFGPDPLRNNVVKTLCKVPGADSTAALVEYIASVPGKEKRLSVKTAKKCIEKRGKRTP